MEQKNYVAFCRKWRKNFSFNAESTMFNKSWRNLNRRIHSRKLQEEVFGVLGYSKEEVASRFDQLLTAFEYGTPPHGGIATGIERLVMLLAGTDNIRDVVAFPKTQSFIDPLFDAPDYVSNEQLNELHIKVNPTET